MRGWVGPRAGLKGCEKFAFTIYNCENGAYLRGQTYPKIFTSRCQCYKWQTDGRAQETWHTELRHNSGMSINNKTSKKHPSSIYTEQDMHFIRSDPIKRHSSWFSRLLLRHQTALTDNSYISLRVNIFTRYRHAALHYCLPPPSPHLHPNIFLCRLTLCQLSQRCNKWSATLSTVISQNTVNWPTSNSSIPILRNKNNTIPPLTHY